MGDVIELRRRNGGCSQWQQSHARIDLVARPACASLAMAFAALAAPLKAQDSGGRHATSWLDGIVMRAGGPRRV